MMNQFYNLTPQQSGSQLVVNVLGINDSFRFLRGDDSSQAKIVTTRHMGKLLYDIIPTSYSTLMLMSEHMQHKIRHLTGWHIVQIEMIDSPKLEGYGLLVVTGKCDRIRYDLARKVTYPPIIPDGPPWNTYEGVYFDVDTWDGSDLFVPEDTGHICITKKAKDMIESARLTNVQITPLEQVELAILRYRNQGT